MKKSGNKFFRKMMIPCLCVAMFSSSFMSLAATTGYYEGDYNKSGSVDAEDVTVLRKALVNGATDDKYDLNDSNVVDVADLVRMKQMTVIGYDDEMEAF